MTFFEFLCVFLVMILIGSPCIIGWYIITRGETYIMPDGSMRKYGMIFKGWAFFWEQSNKTEKLYFTGEELDKKIDLVEKVRPDIGARLFLTDPHQQMMYVREGDLTELEREAVADIMACEVESAGYGHYRPFVRQDIYLFPSWVRKPLSSCPPCMASVYGSLIYWFVVLQVPSIFSWSAKENLAKFGFWIIFCITLACGNKYLNQKLKL